MLNDLYKNPKEGFPDKKEANSNNELQCGLALYRDVNLGTAWEETQDLFITFSCFRSNSVLTVKVEVRKVL